MVLKWPAEFPGVHWLDQEEEHAVLSVLRHGSLFRYYGIHDPKHVDAFEHETRRFYGSRYALALNSGTGALITAMRALDIGPGCEVIVPAFLWVTTVGAVVQVGAIPVLCEIDSSFNMDPSDLEQKINSRTRLIIPVHMAGIPCDMAAIMRIARRHKIPVLEDCAQCNGGTFRGKHVGTFGAMGIFSLQINKNMTCGEGGLIITDSKKLYDRAFSAHDLGMVRKGGRIAMPPAYAVMWGGGRRMTELCGAVARTQIKKLPSILRRMQASKRRIKGRLADIPGIQFRSLADAEGDTGSFLILLLEDAVRARRAARRLKRAGLHSACRLEGYGLHIYYNIPSLVKKAPLPSQGEPWNLPANAASQYDYRKGACPQTDVFLARSLLIPIPSCLTREQEDQAARVIQKAVGR